MTMNNIIPFDYEGSPVRGYINEQEEPWFVGRDVALVLGYSDTDYAIRTHVDEEDKLTRGIPGSGQSRNMVMINESGLYSLIMNSNLPQAKDFKRWVTSEVLPCIRKTGGYQMARQSTPLTQTMEDASAIATFLESRGVKPGIATQRVMRGAISMHPESSQLLLTVAKEMGHEEAEDNKPVNTTALAGILSKVLGLPLDARKLNPKLQELGLQKQVKRGKRNDWILTDKGKEFAQAIPLDLKHSNGSSYSGYQIVWSPDTADYVVSNWN